MIYCPICFSDMEPPLSDNSATPKPSPSPSPTPRPDPPLASSSPSSSPRLAPNSERPKPKLTMPTPSTPSSSSPSTASPRTSPGFFSRSSSLSTPPASPFRQPIGRPSQVGRSQLNAAAENPSTDSTAAGAAAKAPQIPPTLDPGENSTLPLWSFNLFLSLNHYCTVFLPSSPLINASNTTSLCALLCLHGSHRPLPQHVKWPLLLC